MEAYVCVQCRTDAGQVGTFLSSGKEVGGWVAISPVFDSLVELYPWMRANGWASFGVWMARKVV